MKVKDFLTEVRPKTLAASSSPVILASVLAYMDGVFNWVPALLCLGVAMFGQIASNFANDYFDFVNGMDGAGRLGPERVVSTGKAEAKFVLKSSIVFVFLSCICGLGLLFFAPWWFIPVGIAIALAVFGYSAGPFPLSHHGLGDAAVLLFFGLIPLCLTYYAQAGCFSLHTLWYAIAVGLLIVNVLIVNNYRDVEQDRATGKRTTIVRFGRKAGLYAYLANVVIAAGLSIASDFNLIKTILMAAFLGIALSTWVEMKKTDGEALNIPFGHTARNVIFYTLLCSFGLIFG